ncbi:nuclear transport factor 2 family protein [Spirosoma sp. KNUC1025]|uniref:nuclear transport factor 2 family protein n=1 Tax=Spirosoma sp. KNUC1025 TaxID=2894082 RepID=UPI0038639CA7|nr:nuclear transport factor 2 family protein [Spirosoma sp. KNUC1025]
MKRICASLLLIGGTLTAYSQSMIANRSAQAITSQYVAVAVQPVNRESGETVDITPESLIQKQVDAYNARDIDAFLATYADDIELYDLPDKLLAKGKEAMRKQYGTLFSQAKSLHCEIANRIVINNTVIDHEKVTINPNQPTIQAVAIYKVENGAIKKCILPAKTEPIAY